MVINKYLIPTKPGSPPLDLSDLHLHRYAHREKLNC